MNKTETVYIVFKTHFDIGFTALASEVIERYGKKMLPDVIATCASTEHMGEGRRFVWTMSAWPLIESLNGASPEDAEKARKLICEGRIAWHALPYTTHTEFCGYEEFIRGLAYSRKLSGEFGHWPVSAKMTDVPGHTWALPSLLAAAGVKFLHLGCNSCSMPPDVPRLFFWEGPDGARVLTFYSKGSYGSSLLPPEDWPFPVWLALMQTGDNLGPQGPEDIEPLLDEVRDELPGARAAVGTLDDFYLALSQYPLGEVPVIRGDLADTWIHGVGSYPVEVGRMRALRPRLTETEKAFSLMDMLDCVTDADRARLSGVLSEAYGLSLLFGEHTWGLDVKETLHKRYYSKKAFLAHKRDADYVRIEQSWREQRDRALGAARTVYAAQTEVMHALAKAVSAEGRRVAVFNGLGWKRSAWADVSGLGANITALADAEGGPALPVLDMRGRRVVKIPDLPAFGYRTLIPAKTPAKPAHSEVMCDAVAGVLENARLRITVDKLRGSISSLVDKATGHEWAGEGGIGRYRYDVYGIEDVTEFIRAYCYRFTDWVVKDQGRVDYPEIPHSTYWAEGFTVTAERDGASASLVMTAALDHESVATYGNATKLQVRVTLCDGEPHADIEYTLLDKQETPYIEAGHAVFPFSLANHSVRINKLGSVIDPMSDIVRSANHGLMCCENWVDLSDGGRGMAVIPFDMPLFSMGEQAIYQYHPEAKPKPPTLLFNLFNNSWGTNFPQWMGGDMTFRYRLMPHLGDWQQGRVQQAAMEAVTPALIGCAEGQAGSLPVSGDFMKLPGDVMAAALKPAYGGQGWALRLRSLACEDTAESAELNLPAPNAVECDLMERKLAGEGADAPIKPFGVKTYLLTK